MDGPIPNMRSYFTKAVVSELQVLRRDGGFVFSIHQLGKDAVTHWLSEPEASMLGYNLQHPELFGIDVALHTETESLSEGT